LQRGVSSGAALALHLAVDKTTLSRNLKPLLAAKLVTARRAEHDAREIRYALSVAGQRRLAKAMPLWQAAHAHTETLLGKQAASMQRSLQNATAFLG
jgi:DNA-binding MarR family transcriptional regulator